MYVAIVTFSRRIIYILPWHDWAFKVSLKLKSFINTRESHGPSFVLRLLKISLTRLLSSVRWTILVNVVSTSMYAWLFFQFWQNDGELHHQYRIPFYADSNIHWNTLSTMHQWWVRGIHLGLEAAKPRLQDAKGKLWIWVRTYLSSGQQVPKFQLGDLS